MKDLVPVLTAGTKGRISVMSSQNERCSSSSQREEESNSACDEVCTCTLYMYVYTYITSTHQKKFNYTANKAYWYTCKFMSNSKPLIPSSKLNVYDLLLPQLLPGGMYMYITFKLIVLQFSSCSRTTHTHVHVQLQCLNAQEFFPLFCHSVCYTLQLPRVTLE